MDADGGPFSLFPSLSTLALHISDWEAENLTNELVVEQRCVMEVALLESLYTRQEKGAPLKEVLVARAMAEWDVWDRVKELVHVEFF